MTTLTYDHLGAVDLATRAAEMQLGRLTDELNDEYEEAVDLAKVYAVHLATGGDPWAYPQPSADMRGRRNHGLARVAREAVFDVWNEARERRSISYPWGQAMPYRWWIHEYMLDRLGEPVPVAELRKIGTRTSPNDVAHAVWAMQVTTNGDLRVRKTKADGKVAWLVRPFRMGDNEADVGWRDGVYGYGRADLSDEKRREALERGFREHVSEYPEEVI